MLKCSLSYYARGKLNYSSRADRMSKLNSFMHNISAMDSSYLPLDITVYRDDS